jgi:TIR domain
MADGTRKYDVFISHAGRQKAGFAAWLQRELNRHGVSAFLDERSLRLGDEADVVMESALRSCSIVVAVLTADFVRSKYCMQELHWALHLKQPHRLLQQEHASTDAVQPAQQKQNADQRSPLPPLLMPVFHGTSDINTLQHQLMQDINAIPAEDPAGSWLQQRAADLEAACRHTGDRPDSHGKWVPHFELLLLFWRWNTA